MDEITITKAFLASLFSFIDPTVLFIVPFFCVYMACMFFVSFTSEINTLRFTMLQANIFIAGFMAIFISLGASATTLGSFLQSNMGLFRSVGGILILFFGVYATGLINFLTKSRAYQPKTIFEPICYIGSFFFGLAFAASWTPSINAYLATILMVAATEDTIQKGVLLLFVYSVGLAVPLFFTAYIAHEILASISKFSKYIQFFEVISGVLFSTIGLLVFNNYLNLAKFNQLLGNPMENPQIYSASIIFVIISITIVFGVTLKLNGGNAMGNIIMVLIGISMIVFASTCFKDVPLIGTVFLMPGENVMNAKMANPILRYALFLIGAIFTAFGIFLQTRTGFANALGESSHDTVNDKPISDGVNLSGLKEAKELLDSGAITDEEYAKIKNKFIN